MKIEIREQLAETLAAIIPSYGRQIRAAGAQQSIFETKKWAELTKDLTIDQINVALERIVKHESEFEPSASRFRFLAFGLVDTAQAYIMAQHGDYACLAVYHARMAMGKDFEKLGEIACEKVFARHYAYYCDQVLEGRQLQGMQQQITADKHVPAVGYAQHRTRLLAKYGESIRQKLEDFEAVTKDWTWENHRDFYFQEVPKMVSGISLTIK